MSLYKWSQLEIMVIEEIEEVGGEAEEEIDKVTFI